MQKNKTLRSVAFALAFSAVSLAGHAMSPTPMDSEISTGVKAAIQASNISNPSDLHVAIQNGQVNITGWARNGEERDLAVKASKGVAGVKVVYGNSVRLWSSRYSAAY